MAKVECSQYESCLSTLNTSVIDNLQEIRENATQIYDQPAENTEGGETQQMNVADRMAHTAQVQKKLKEMLKSLTLALETVGMVNPFNKVYFLSKPLEKISLFMSLFTLSLLKEITFDQKLSTFRKIEDPKKPRQPGQPNLIVPHLLVGILTMFKQFHNSHYRFYVQHLTHYYKTIVHVTQGKQVPAEGQMVLMYLDELLKFDNQSREVVGQALGGFIFDCYNM